MENFSGLSRQVPSISIICSFVELFAPPEFGPNRRESLGPQCSFPNFLATFSPSHSVDPSSGFDSLLVDPSRFNGLVDYLLHAFLARSLLIYLISRILLLFSPPQPTNASSNIFIPSKPPSESSM